MSDDLVAELDRWLAVYNFAGLIDMPVVLRARDEIVALREVASRVPMLATLGNIAADGLMKAREEALEEAARVCEGGYTTGSTASMLKAIAAAIRALKQAAP